MSCNRQSQSPEELADADGPKVVGNFVNELYGTECAPGKRDPEKRVEMANRLR
ncbi:MAG: hypothetical protein OEU68_09765 [Nitrospira sp.]|nr:hypothetical protein [Nitrospira sp.]MDH4243470.1 hypothetical protein [Nitrospira sp.]MDH4356801.1 hypothetical protein [Nitrospira sp.]MDH5318455.1 hypothetical protein [Nitrospira sp.]